MWRNVLAALMLSTGALAVAAAPAKEALTVQTAEISAADLLRAAALDELCAQIGPAIAGLAGLDALPSEQSFLSHWQLTAAIIFDAEGMEQQLVGAIEASIAPGQRAAMGRFFASALGRRITALEHAVLRLDAASQTRALLEGRRLLEEADDGRRAVLEDMLLLVGPEVSVAFSAQSTRAMLLRLTLSQQRGSIEVPWEQIDAQVGAMLPGLLASVTEAQGAMSAYAYRGLDDDELQRYRNFLATPEAQHLYAVAGRTFADLLAERMHRFGETLARRLASVNA